MKNRRTYGPEDTMCDLIENDHRVLFIMSNLGIRLGIGDKTIGQICHEAGIDTGTFFAIVDVVIYGDRPHRVDFSAESIPALLDGLRGTHSYYLEQRLPELRNDLIRAWGDSENDLLKAMVLCYDEFVECLREHIALEERTIFRCAASLAEGNLSKHRCEEVRSQVREHEREHGLIMSHMVELRRLLVRYYPAHDTHRMNNVLLELQGYELVMNMHSTVEEVMTVWIVEQTAKATKAAKAAKVMEVT